MNPPLSQPREVYNYTLEIEKNQKNSSEIERDNMKILSTRVSYIVSVLELMFSM